MKEKSAVTIASEQAIKELRSYVFSPEYRDVHIWVDVLQQVFGDLNPDFSQDFLKRFIVANKTIIVSSNEEAVLDYATILTNKSHGPHGRLRAFVQVLEVAPQDRPSQKTKLWFVSFVEATDVRGESVKVDTDVLYLSEPIGLMSSKDDPSISGNCDFCEKKLDPTEQVALLTEEALERLETTGALRRLGPPSLRDPSRQMRWVACLNCMNKTKNTAKEGLNDKLRSINCDFCSKSLPSNEAVIVPLKKLQHAVRNGFNPFVSGVKHPMPEIAKVVGGEMEIVNEEWRQQVLRDTTDWQLCSSCAHIFQERTSSFLARFGQAVSKFAGRFQK